MLVGVFFGDKRGDLSASRSDPKSGNGSAPNTLGGVEKCVEMGVGEWKCMQGCIGSHHGWKWVEIGTKDVVVTMKWVERIGGIGWNEVPPLWVERGGNGNWWMLDAATVCGNGTGATTMGGNRWRFSSNIRQGEHVKTNPSYC